MFRSLSLLSLVVLVALVPVGCNEQLMEKREAPLMGQPGNWDAMSKYYEPMVRNASAYDLSLADGYFFPHSGKLNSLGAKQLNRLCESLDQFGGTIHYETRMTDEDLIAARIESVELYLIDSGADMTNIKVVAGLPRGRGVWARDALRAVTKAEAAAGSSGSASGASLETASPGR